MKYEYLEPEIDVIRFANCDIVTESVGEGDENLSVGVDDSKDF